MHGRRCRRRARQLLRCRVSVVAAGVFSVRAKIVDPRTGKTKEAKKTVEAATAQEAAGTRAELLRTLAEEAMPGQTRVSHYAKSWIESKTANIDEGTARRYAEALDLHVLPELGAYFYDALRPADVQTCRHLGRRIAVVTRQLNVGRSATPAVSSPPASSAPTR